MPSQIWAQKYAPHKLGEFIGNNDASSRAKRWALEWGRGNAQKSLCFWGAPGIGKSALTLALASDMGWETNVFSPYLAQDKDNFIKNLSSALSGSSLLGTKPLVILEEVDTWAKSGMRGLISELALVLAERKAPAILTATDWYERSLSPLRTSAEQVAMKAVNSSDMEYALKRIASAESFLPSSEALAAIVSRSGGDLRAAINDLQAANTGASREREQQIFQKLRMALRAPNYRASRQIRSGALADRDMLKMYIAENLPSEFPDLHDRARAYSRISRADVFDGRIKRLQYWGYLRYSSDLMNWGVASERLHPGAAFASYAFPSYIQKMGASRARRALFKSAAKKISAMMHTTSNKAKAYFPLLAAQGDAQAISAYWGFDEDETASILGSQPKSPKGKKAAGKSAKA